MEVKEYQKLSERTLAKLNKLYPDDNAHMIFGMITEIGELADVFKKNMAYDKPLDLVNVQEEVGDLMWYIANFCNIHGFDLSKILQKNVDKLRARYPEDFTQEKALNRNLDRERQILDDLGFPQKISPSTSTINFKDMDVKVIYDPTTDEYSLLTDREER